MSPEHDLKALATTLAREVKGAFGIAERDLRAALGNTNAACLLEAAEKVLAFEERLSASTSQPPALMADTEALKVLALVQQLRHRADMEDPGNGYGQTVLPPEITWGEMAEIAALCRESADALERLSAERPGTWQPIKTSPEADKVMVWLPNYGHITAYRTGRDWFATGLGTIVYPTHWMPLPGAPGATSQYTPGTFIEAAVRELMLKAMAEILVRRGTHVVEEASVTIDRLLHEHATLHAPKAAATPAPGYCFDQGDDPSQQD